MKTRFSFLMLCTLSGMVQVMAQGFDDDLYYHPSFRTKDKKVVVATDALTDALVNTVATNPSALSTSSMMSTRSVDEYNRRPSATSLANEDTLYLVSMTAEEYSDFQYSERIRRFHNGKFTTHITDGYMNVYVEDGANVTINYNDGWVSPWYYDRYYDPFWHGYGWSWSWGCCCCGWHHSWYWGGYHPWYYSWYGPWGPGGWGPYYPWGPAPIIVVPGQYDVWGRTTHYADQRRFQDSRDTRRGDTRESGRDIRNASADRTRTISGGGGSSRSAVYNDYASATYGGGRSTSSTDTRSSGRSSGSVNGGYDNRSAYSGGTRNSYDSPSSGNGSSSYDRRSSSDRSSTYSNRNTSSYDRSTASQDRSSYSSNRGSVTSTYSTNRSSNRSTAGSGYGSSSTYSGSSNRSSSSSSRSSSYSNGSSNYSNGSSSSSGYSNSSSSYSGSSSRSSSYSSGSSYSGGGGYSGGGYSGGGGGSRAGSGGGGGSSSGRR